MAYEDSLVAVVPVYNPEPGLLGLCVGLRKSFGVVIVVDDGSVEGISSFAELPSGVVLLRHGVNRGKGRAMKTALAWLRENAPKISAVAFADGDGQHRLSDIVAVASHARNSGRVTLGVRDFGSEGIPFRSRFGNVLTSFLVRLIFRLRIYDTQTGLRAFPVRLIGRLIDIPGERYDYEMRLFGAMHEAGEAIEQVPIRTIYLEGNRSSHFRPVQDSIKVYRGLFGGSFVRFCASGAASFLLDNSVFTVLVCAFGSVGFPRKYAILVSLAFARFISGTFNYTCNRRIVFRSGSLARVSFPRYVLLAILVAGLSCACTVMLSAVADASGALITAIKVLGETMLFVFAYKVQKKWVFKK